MSSIAITRSATRIPHFDVHDRARKARISADMEQTDLMAATGISMTTISAIENGKVKPRRTTLTLWALATGVSLDWLLTGAEPGNDETPSRGRGFGGLLPGLDSNQEPAG